MGATEHGGLWGHAICLGWLDLVDDIIASD